MYSVGACTPRGVAAQLSTAVVHHDQRCLLATARNSGWARARGSSDDIGPVWRAELAGRGSARWSRLQVNKLRLASVLSFYLAGAAIHAVARTG